ncbi:alpha-amylase [Streptococcus dentiloxodontae]
MANGTIMQYFEWYLPDDGRHWQRLAADAAHLKEIGISMVWMPPAFKGTSKSDVGYGVYDLFDLGEFDQKGTIATKYGKKADYLKAIEALHEAGIQAVADIVLNHKAGGDVRERFRVLKMNPSNRQEPISEPYEIEGWTGFDFAGRNNTYSDFKWHWYHFTGLDYDALHNETGIYMILGDNKGWADQDQVDNENGNYDYLMFNDIDFENPEAVSHLKDWVQWFLETTKVDGFRLDAVKHIGESFMTEFISHIREHIKPDLYAFAEYWKGDSQATSHYIADTGREFDLVDVVLHMNLFEAGKRGKDYDLTQILTGSLVQNDALEAVTFVDNHDSQRGQALESCIEEWFKPAAYSLILLRQQGLPCVFYGDYYGISGDFAQKAFQTEIDKMLYLRQHHVYGEQVDYFDHSNCIGWVNLGSDEHPEGSAIVISNSDAGWKRMNMGSLNAGKIFVDYLGGHPDQVQIEADGWAAFPVQAGAVSAWINKEALPHEK